MQGSLDSGKKVDIVQGFENWMRDCYIESSEEGTNSYIEQEKVVKQEVCE